MWRFMNHQPIKLANSQTIIVFQDNQDKENDGKVNTLPEWTAGSFLRSAQIEYMYLDLELLNQSTFHRKLQGTLTLKTSTVPVVQRTYVQFGCCCRQTQSGLGQTFSETIPFWGFPVLTLSCRSENVAICYNYLQFKLWAFRNSDLGLAVFCFQCFWANLRQFEIAGFTPWCSFDEWLKYITWHHLN